MHTRAVRFALLFLFLGSIGAASYLFWKGESLARAQTAEAGSFDASARAAERVLLDIRAAQRAYVAAGQGGDFWAARVAQSVEGMRKATTALRADATTVQARTSLDEILSTVNDFVRIDKRAVEYVRRDQRLLASDVIFADGLELTDAALTSLEQARTAEAAARAEIVDTARRRGIFAITAGAAAAVLAVLLLLPNPSKTAGIGARSATIQATDRQRTDSAPAAEGEAWSRPRRAAVPVEGEAQGSTAASATEEGSSAPAQQPAPRSAEQSALVESANTDFIGVASLCVDLARVVDTRALPSLLDRAAFILDASGIILWIADPDGRELNPIFAQGYPQQLVNRLGTIPRDAENATAAAFRTSLLQTVMADEISVGAIAAPLVTPGGCVGVMAAEVRHDSERQDMKLAAATIVAAQLATLVGPPAGRNHSKAGAAGA
jgi:CHASE3 domain sensor protein